MSANGRYVVFTSGAARLVAGDTNRSTDVFVRDRKTDVTRRVSVTTGGSQANNDSFQPTISADGRYVAFASEARNLVAHDSNGTADVFVRDRVDNVTRRVSVAADGQGDSNGTSLNPAISADGRYVAFESWAKNLVSGELDNNSRWDVFVRDRVDKVTSRVSRSMSDDTKANGGSYQPAISAHGRYVAFQSFASNLVNDDTNGQSDVFVRDRDTQETSRVSVSSDGAEGTGASIEPDISADGQRVVFRSAAENLVTGDNNAEPDVFLRDRATDTTTLVSAGRGDDGIPPTCCSGQPAISSDGNQVAFYSNLTNLIAGDTNGEIDVFVRDLVDMTTRRVSVANGGGQANDYSFQPAISAHGRYVSFTSAASNLIARDTNGDRDVFVRDRGTG
ncbi:MAG: PD40 domain-containing protein [Propionibacteriales bacterium]|nr:PD40 domain-containing protein [Propionibacteriales bacterium]